MPLWDDNTSLSELDFSSSGDLSPNTAEEMAQDFFCAVEEALPVSTFLPDFDIEFKVPTLWESTRPAKYWTSVVQLEYRGECSSVPADQEETSHFTSHGSFKFNTDDPGLERVYEMFRIGEPGGPSSTSSEMSIEI